MQQRNIFPYLRASRAKKVIATHYVDKLSDREMLIKKVEIIPVEVVMRNVVAGSLSKRMGIPKRAKSCLNRYWSITIKTTTWAIR